MFELMRKNKTINKFDFFSSQLPMKSVCANPHWPRKKMSKEKELDSVCKLLFKILDKLSHPVAPTFEFATLKFVGLNGSG